MRKMGDGPHTRGLMHRTVNSFGPSEDRQSVAWYSRHYFSYHALILIIKYYDINYHDATRKYGSFNFIDSKSPFRDILCEYYIHVLNSGAHGVGFCHCGFVIDRLYNFQATGLSDPRIDPAMLATLKQQCPPEVVLPSNITKDPKIFLNQATTSPPFVLDTSFYHSLLNGKAVLQLDQDLAFTDVTSRLAALFVSNPKRFIHQFSKSMIKLGSVGVLTGGEGEIRLNCRKVNSKTWTAA